MSTWPPELSVGTQTLPEAQSQSELFFALTVTFVPSSLRATSLLWSRWFFTSGPLRNSQVIIFRHIESCNLNVLGFFFFPAHIHCQKLRMQLNSTSLLICQAWMWKSESVKEQDLFMPIMRLRQNPDYINKEILNVARSRLIILKQFYYFKRNDTVTGLNIFPPDLRSCSSEHETLSIQRLVMCLYFHVIWCFYIRLAWQVRVQPSLQA